MKLRIRGNSVRLRLTRPEVEQLLTTGAVEERTCFADGGALGYRVMADAAVSEPGVAFRDGVVTVRLPPAAVERWGRATVVGLEHATPLRNGGELRLLVEKDFACLNPARGESEEGAFPNPRKGEACCDPSGPDQE